jgi:CarD family transcriptional regulator
MFKVNELVIYGTEGICQVLDICSLDMPDVDREKLYYVLKSLYCEGTIYAPVDTKIFMRPIISREKAQQIINQIPDIEAEIYINKSLRELNDYYKEKIQSHNCIDLIQLLKSVYAKRNNLVNSKKKLGVTDENYARKAEYLLHGELAAALKIPKEDVYVYIESRVNKLYTKNNIN